MQHSWTLKQATTGGKKYVVFSKDPTLEKRIIAERLPLFDALVAVKDVNWLCDSGDHLDLLKKTASFPEAEQKTVAPCLYHGQLRQTHAEVHCALEDVRRYAVAWRLHTQQKGSCKRCVDKDKNFDS